MLGFAAVSGRAVSGNSALIAVPAALAASGAFLTFSGSTNPGFTLPAIATGTIVQFSGVAIPQWLQAAATQGTFLNFSGTATAWLLGKPVVLSALPQSFTARARMDRYTAKALPQSYTLRGR